MMSPLPQPPAFVLSDYHVHSDRVGLIDLTGQQFREPFFVQSVGRRAHGSLAPLEIGGDRASVKAAVQRLAQESAIPCGGLIFHTGRCGSTLLANALSAIDSLLVLKEPPFAQQISADLLVYRTVDPGQLRERATDVCDHLVAATRPGQSRYVLKFTSWNALCAGHWQEILHHSPAIFLWRRAVDVLESVAENPAGWILGEESTISPEQLADRWIAPPRADLPYPLGGALEVWRSVAKAGLRLAAEGALVLEYDEVIADFSSALQQLLQHLSVPYDPTVLAEAVDGARHYSKDPSRPWSTAGRAETRFDRATVAHIERSCVSLEDALRNAGGVGVR